MSGQPYIDGATLDEVREALRQGQPLERIAGKLQMTPEHLRNMLGLPSSKPSPAKSDGTDLFDCERLDGVL